jgi:hypothetical protein
MNKKSSRKKVLIVIASSIIFTFAIYMFFSYAINRSSFNSLKLLPEEAYVIILHEKFNRSVNDLSTITFDEIKDNFTYRYVLVRGNGSLYQIDNNNNAIVKNLGMIEPPTTSGTHFAWEITTNNTKYYVDSTSGQIISQMNFSSSRPSS